MSTRKRIANKKAGLSGLFHTSALAAILLIALSASLVAEPFAVEVTAISAGFDERTHQPVINIRMGPESKKLFAEITGKNVGHKMEVRIDGKTALASVIREPILGGSLQVSNGSWTPREAQDLAGRLSAGKAKIEFEVLGE